VRTTLTLDDDVAARLAAEARRHGRPFKVVVNEMLRAGLSQQRSAEKQAPFKVKTHDFGGLQAGLSLDNIGALLEQLEGLHHR
jgi:plasmid stability protein